MDLRTVVGCLGVSLAAASLLALRDGELRSGPSTTRRTLPAAAQARPERPAPRPANAGVAVVTSSAVMESEPRRAERAAPVGIRLVVYLETAPLAHARVRVGARETITDADGRATLELAPGLHEVRAPDLPDAEACVAQGWWLRSDFALRGVVFERGGPRPRVGGALVRVWRDDELDAENEEDEEDEHAVELFHDGEGLVLVRFLAPWVTTGEVVDAATGAPIARATVGVEGVRVVTDEAGAFRIATPGDRDRDPPVLTISAPGYGTVATSAGRERVRLALRPALSLCGRALDLEGRPLRATVEAGWRLPDPTTGDVIDDMIWAELPCDADGRFRTEGLAPGARAGRGAGPHAAVVDVLVRCQGYASEQVQALMTPDRAAEVEVRLDRTWPVVGRVVAPDGRAVVGADVNTTECEPHETDALGRFRIGSMPERATFRVLAAGFPPQRFQAWLPVVGELVLRLREAPAHPGSIHGRAVDADGAPIAGLLVHGERTDRADERARSFAPARGEVTRIGVDDERAERRSARTDATGRFTLDGLPEGGRFELLTTTPRYRRLAVDVPVGAQGVALVAARPQLGRVRLRVEAEHDAPITITVEHADGSRSHLTSSHGRPRRVVERTEWLEAGRHTLVARAPGHALSARPFVVRAGEDITLPPLWLSPGGGAIALGVRWPRRPIQALCAKLHYLDGDLRVAVWLEPPSVPDVPLLMSGLAAGRVTLALTALGPAGDERSSPERTVTIRDALTETVEVDLP